MRKGTLSTAFAVVAVGFPLLLIFAAPVLNGIVSLARWLGAN